MYVKIDTKSPLDMMKYEKFSQDLLPKDKIIVIQGNGIPNTPFTEASNMKDTMFPYAYNKCKLECCKNSEYSCNGGCVCLTDEQRKKSCKA